MQALPIKVGTLDLVELTTQFTGRVSASLRTHTRLVLKTLKLALAGLPLLLIACGGGGGEGEDGSPAAVAMGTGFSMAVAPASFAVGQGQDALVEVIIKREAGFTEPVRVTLNQPAAGIQADTLVLFGSLDRGLLPIRISADLVAGSVQKLDLMGTGGGTSRVASSNITVTVPEAYAQNKIAAALEAGTLDYGTALLYRAYALFGDNRLPDSYLGAGSIEEDNGLFAEIAQRFASLPIGAQNQLQPFIVRPADPRSVWNAPTPTNARANSAKKTSAAASPSVCPPMAAGSWINKRSANHPVRVWAQCRGVSGVDADSVTLIDKTLVVLNKIYTPMTGLMGLPLFDLEGDDNAIDFYIVDNDSYVYRRTENFRPIGLGTTYTDYAETPVGKGDSAFVTLPRSLLYTGRFHITVIHEFFHVLQFAHNSEFSLKAVAGKPDSYESHWFMEASATWASAHFDRTLAPWDSGRGAYLGAHYLFAKHFLPSHDALNHTGIPHVYSAYIWPYFVEQETGGANFMTNIWVALEAVTTFEAADNVIDKVYSFASNFKRFALRNLNTELIPGDPLPISQRHVNLDADQFADDRVEPRYLTGALPANQDYSQDFELKNLSARYVRLTVPQASPAVRKVVVDISGLQPASELDVQAFVLTDDGWVAQPIDIKPDKLVFCFDKGPTTAEVRGSFKEILLVVSNHAIAKGTDISGTLKVQPKSLPCATVWEGTIDHTIRPISVAGITITTHANVIFEFDDTADQVAREIPFRLRSGTFTYEELYESTGRNPPCRTIVTGAGPIPLAPYQPFVPSGTSARMLIFPETFEYGGSGLSVIRVTSTSNCNDRNVDEITINPIFTAFWWLAHPGGISADGNSIRHMYTTPTGVTSDIRFDRKPEGG